MISYRNRPSLGFVFLTTALAGSAAFFAWGIQRPRLEEVWRADIELGLGERPPLSRAEMNRLQETLVDHPPVGESLREDRHAGIFSANDGGRVEGTYAYLIRQRADQPGLLTVTYAGARKRGKVRVQARTVTASSSGQVRPDHPWHWQLPASGPFPQLVEVLLAPAKKSAKHHAVRIDLVGAP
jgi:hypothetical protein